MRLKVLISQIFKQLVNFLTLIARWQLTKQHHQVKLTSKQDKSLSVRIYRALACICQVLMN